MSALSLDTLGAALICVAAGYIVAKSRIGSPVRAALDMIFARHDLSGEAVPSSFKMLHRVVLRWAEPSEISRWFCARCQQPATIPLLAEGYHCPICLSGELALVTAICGVTFSGLALTGLLVLPSLTICISLLLFGGGSAEGGT